MGTRLAVLVVTVLLAATLVAGPVGAQANPAQTTTTQFEPLNYIVQFPDPCNPEEEVTINGTATGHITEVLTPTGDYIYSLHLQQKGTGVGSQGSQYQNNQFFNERLTAASPEASLSVYSASIVSLVNNLGSGSNFLMKQTIHVTGLPNDPVVSFFFEHAECLG